MFLVVQLQLTGQVATAGCAPAVDRERISSCTSIRTVQNVNMS